MRRILPRNTVSAKELAVAHFIGVDVGGTTSTICVGNERREVCYVSDQFETRSDEGPHATVAAIVHEALKGAKQAGCAIHDVEAVGLATPGPATLDGVLLKTPNLDPQRWDRFPIRAELERAFQQHQPQLRVHYIGDGQAAALGEFALRSGSVSWSRVAASHAPESISSLFMVIVGTGLGGGAVREGVPVRGMGGRAGHVGHILLPVYAFREEHDRRLLVGNSYCTAESTISLTGLSHQLEHRLSLQQWRDHELNALPGSTRDKAKRLRGLAAAGDPLARQLFDDQARALGIALLSVNYLGDYDRLVIGGGVCDLAADVRDAYRQRAEESYLRHALDGFRDKGVIEFSICGDDAPVIGALAWVISRCRPASLIT